MPRSSTVIESLNRASREASQRIVTEALAGIPSTTEVGKLIDEFSKSDFDTHFRAMTLGDLMEALGASAAPRAGRRRATAASAAAPKAQRKGLNTRTAAGRAELDAAFCAYLEKAGMAGSEELQTALGVTAAQIRQSAKRQPKQIKVTGQKRATKYNWKASAAASEKKSPARKKKARKK